MSRPQALSIRSTLWIAIALAVASSIIGTTGLMGFRLSRQFHMSERIRVQAVAEVYAVQIAARMNVDRQVKGDALLNGLAWHPSSRLLVVLGTDDKFIAGRGTTGLLEEYRRVKKSGVSTWRLHEWGDEQLPEYTVAAVPIRYPGSDEVLGTVVYTMDTPKVGAWSRSGGWSYFACLIAIGATGMALGFLWLKRHVLDPLGTLSRIGPDVKPAHLLDGLPLDRSDEIGDLARMLSSLHMDIEEWRSRAVRLENSIDDRVAHATERITRELKSAQKKIWTDPLTRLGNRRLLDDKFAEIFEAQRASKKELSIVMIDVDYFKQLNDTLGHQAGDELLEFTGELLKQCLREQDLAIRYGGDEFVLILPSVTSEQAYAIAERTIAMFAQRSKLLPVVTRPTISAGIASLSQHRAISAEQLLQMADTALYQAKFTGKGRAIVFSRSYAPRDRMKLTT